ncbi:tetratricopeptide repeat protein [Candidatus Nitrosotenuis chungbukensis]|uniref:tetratricopeptide repeat protein n=1 Tax=Candidatus Nitrosotenuis chungbukensis TaxID=1353246 RepID=UPI002671EB6D|nr:tetratricopeptide repeat protein [Candidatus Nitrosotenuis chungbukensis]WKT57411.1 tetratricopeptide repeat protein [Candidatus Nitrosotenuis chungbukensis]
MAKLKDHERAIRCYDEALQITPNDKTILINKASSLRKMKKYGEAINYCNQILEENPKDAIALYHKERILFSLGNYRDSVYCCDVILEGHSENGDVLFDKSASLAMLDSTEHALDTLREAVRVSRQFKIKAKNHKAFAKLYDNPRFLQLVSD